VTNRDYIYYIHNTLNNMHRFSYIIRTIILFFILLVITILINSNVDNSNIYYKFKNNVSGGFTTITQKNQWNDVANTKILLAHKKLDLDFTAQSDYLGTIAIPFDTNNESIHDRIVFRIKEASEKNWFHQNVYDTNQIQDNVPFPFGFPIIQHSKGIHFKVEIESMDGRKNNHLSLNTNNRYFLAEYIYSKANIFRSQRVLSQFLYFKIYEHVSTLTIPELSLIILISLIIQILPYKSLFSTKNRKKYTESPKKSFTNRVDWVDAGKGLGLILVIFGHLVTMGTVLSNWIFSFHMPLFFFLSGYVTKIPNRSISYSSKRIFVNLIVPYFVFVTVGLLVSLAIPIWRHINIDQLLVELFYSGVPSSIQVSQLWFLICLAVTQFMAIVFFRLNHKDITITIMLVFVFALIAYLINIYQIGFWVHGVYYRLPWMTDTAFMGLFFFLIGFYSNSLKIFSKLTSHFSYSNIVKILIFLIISFYFGTQLNHGASLSANFYGNLTYFLIAALAGIIFIIYISRFFENNKLLIYLGKNTLPIYASQSFILSLFQYLLNLILHKKFAIMVNVPLLLCFLGLVLIIAVLIIVSIVYNNTIQKLILKLQ